jgi:hypothetical protein
MQAEYDWDVTFKGAQASRDETFRLSEERREREFYDAERKREEVFQAQQKEREHTFYTSQEQLQRDSFAMEAQRATEFHTWWTAKMASTKMLLQHEKQKYFLEEQKYDEQIAALGQGREPGGST